jgi:tetratricopeptide (TPR) repeat protein
MMQGQVEDASHYGEEHLALARKMKAPWHIFRALTNLGYALYLQGHSQEAIHLYQEAMQVVEAMGSQASLAYASNNLGEIYHAQREEKNAQALFERSLAIFREYDNRRGVAFALHNLGNVAHSASRFVEARDYYEQSLTMYREVGDRRGIAESLKTLGDLVSSVGEYETASRYYRDSLELYEKLGDRRGLADSLVLLGYNLGVWGKFDEAMQPLQRSLQLRQEMGNPADIADTLMHLSLTSILREDWEAGRQYNDSALPILNAPDFHVPQITLRYHSNVGIIAVNTGAHEQARVALEQTQEMLDIIGYRWAMMICQGFLGDAYVGLNDSAKAWLCYRRAAQISYEIQSYDWGVYSIRGIAEMLAAGGQVERAIEFLAFVQDFPATSQFSRNRAARALRAWSAKLASATCTEAVKRGQRMDITTALEQVLAVKYPEL